ncbi:LysR family transcriptional regulator [Phytomonospora endophytica]|uniref:DNA-binding transcriptional LysR family regulator n=1 Tax=Phytomonospora endophytica TaxID=714109 RepID=A0A841FJV3_9ACTN|nr:LysR family transcriptional regulator [Phytomonospora endophytica]MBB6037601.1 DNA-binding transcriptional LysR family regulator [Phytomonospora endophytica]GIG67873.1 LysR family transcriptional regulator [Phytomonospora endophytica]
MFDLARLRALHAVAVYGTVGAAAAALGYTPSAVSQQIAKLERETRSVLLERQGRGVVLTDAAHTLVEAAAELLAIVERTEVALEEQRGKAVGMLTIGAFATAVRGLMPGVVSDLMAACPGLDVRLRDTDPYPAAEMVGRGELDLAVVQDWPSTPLSVPPEVSREVLGHDPVDLLVPTGHRLAERERVRPEELRGERWISVPPGNICHDWLTRLLRGVGEEPLIAVEASEFEAYPSLISRGLGIGLVPRLGRTPLPDDVVARAVQPAPSRRVFALWRTRSSRRPAIRAALGALRARWPVRETA